MFVYTWSFSLFHFIPVGTRKKALSAHGHIYQVLDTRGGEGGG